MNFGEIKELIHTTMGAEVIESENSTAIQPHITIHKSHIARVCDLLRKNEQTYFDFLSCITAIDNGPAAGTMEVLYHLYSIVYEHHLVLKVLLKRTEENTNDPLPHLPSVNPVYKTALWHEREIFDFFGIVFDGHPDLRRIFLPEDWKGFPLRKDYHQEEYYRGIKIDY